MWGDVCMYRGVYVWGVCMCGVCVHVWCGGGYMCVGCVYVYGVCVSGCGCVCMGVCKCVGVVCVWECVCLGDVGSYWV